MGKNIYIILVCMILGVTSAAGQHKTYIKVNPTTLVNELDVYLEQELSRSTSIELNVGGIYTDYWDNILNQFNFGQYRPALTEHQYLNGRGFVARLGVRYYVISPYATDSRARGTYFEPVILYRQIWYPNSEVNIASKTYHEKGEKQVGGLQLLIGRQYRKNKIYIDKYIGLGVKAKTYNLDHYQIDQNTNSIQNDGEKTTTWLPSIHLGFKIAFDLSNQ